MTSDSLGACRNSLNAALERMGLRHFFAAQVTAEDGMETTSQRFLSAAIKLSRPPKDCVVFESSPLGVTAAHNCSCKAGLLSWRSLCRAHVQGVLLVEPWTLYASQNGLKVSHSMALFRVPLEMQTGRVVT